MINTYSRIATYIIKFKSNDFLVDENIHTCTISSREKRKQSDH